MKTNITKMIQRSTLLFITVLLFNVGAFADSDHNEARKLKEAGKILPLEQIIASARQLYSGHILEIELEHEDGRYIYELEILDDNGTVWELEYDAKNGKLIKQKIDD